MKCRSTYIDTKILSKLAQLFFPGILAQAKHNFLLFAFFLINFHLLIYFFKLIFLSLYGNFNLHYQNPLKRIQFN